MVMHQQFKDMLVEVVVDGQLVAVVAVAVLEHLVEMREKVILVVVTVV
tara:strand:- start:1232 stop:1375 length:144 start_codon:yes stop_codon:yes gene_type:complete